jgi:hypothetical protein
MTDYWLLVAGVLMLGAALALAWADERRRRRRAVRAVREFQRKYYDAQPYD